MKPSQTLPALWAVVMAASLSAQQTAPAPNAAATPAASQDALPPDTWSTRTYRFPADELARGFVTRDKGQIRAPGLPKADASEAEQAEFLKKSDAIVTLYLKEQGIFLPEGSLVAYDAGNQTLVVRTSGKAHEQVDGWTKNRVSKLPTSLTFATYLFEGEATAVREVIKSSAGKGDHSPQLVQLKKLAAEGKARIVDLLRLETRSGQRATVDQGEERLEGTEFLGSQNGWTEVTYDMRKVGSAMELDPVLGPDGETIDINIAIDHHYRLPVDRWEPVAQTSAGLRADARVTDFYTVKVATAQTLMRGTARLLGVWKPEGVQDPAREGRLLVAIVKGDVVPLLAALEPRVEQLFTALGEKVRPTPAVVPGAVQDASLPPGMIIRRFVVTPTFLSAGASERRGDAAAAAPADPFASNPPSDEPRMMVRITALDILRAQGIAFPPGASANFKAATSELIVRNTPENMASVEAFIDSINRVRPVNLAFNIQVVEGNGAFLRDLEEEYAARADHGKMWQAIEDAVAQGKAKYVQTLWVGTRSGQRVKTWVGRDYRYVSEVSGETPAKAPETKPAAGAAPPAQAAVAAPAEAHSGEARLSATMEMRPVGISFELDPVLGPDERTIDVNYHLDRDYAAPSWRASMPSDDPKVVKLDAPATSFHRAQTITAITLLPKMSRLIGLWKPEVAPEGGKADVMQAAFMRVDLDPVGPATK